jgi:hypothetical protein
MNSKSRVTHKVAVCSSKVSKHAVALYSFHGQNPRELNFEKVDSRSRQMLNG